MIENNSILEPLKEYNNKFKTLIRENANSYFEDLTKKAQTDVEANKKTCEKHYETLKNSENVMKIIRKHKKIKGFLIAMIVISLIGVLICASIMYSAISTGDNSIQAIIALCVAILLLAGSIGSIITIVKFNNKIIKNNTSIKAKLDKEAADLKQEAYGQMYTLNISFDYDMANEVVTKTCPLVKLDKCFDAKKLDFMVTKYGYKERDDIDESTSYMLSGSIVGNPFLLRRTLNFYMGSKTYTGSLTIYWTDYDSDGKAYSRSQTLHAQVTKPYPNYYHNTQLIYGNEAAPNLTFTRKNNKAVSSMNEKQLEKHIKKGDKKIKKKESLALQGKIENVNFQGIGNEKFDVLWNALDRNNEVEFRLLFTPLAQNNIVDLITTCYPYGDDFDFYKTNMINIVYSDHSQTANYFAEPSEFMHFDYEVSKNRFIDYTCEFFKALYFDLAPILSIPLYQQHKPIEYIYKEFYPRLFTNYEAEEVANNFDPIKFSHPDTVTRTILKTRFLQTDNNAEKVLVTGYSFAGIPRIDYVQMYGGDGHYHQVPVEWTEYIPLEQDTLLEIKSNELTGPEFNRKLQENDRLSDFINEYSNSENMIYKRGMLGLILGEYQYNDETDALLEDILKENLDAKEE